MSWEDYIAFQGLLKQPAAEFDASRFLSLSLRRDEKSSSRFVRVICAQIAFRYFDTDGNGEVSFDEFKKVLTSLNGPGSLPFNFDSPWVTLYLGKGKAGHFLGFK